MGHRPNNYFYSGERLDSSIGLYDLRARYYNQATGRFWARDPVEGRKCCGLSWNPYIYVKGNPVNAVDPKGEDTIFEFALVYSFSVQRAFVASIAIGKITCDLLRYADLLQTEYAFVKTTVTDDIEPPDEKDILFQQAEQYCDAFFPE